MRTVGLFTKFWQPGRVKTRLAKQIGDENAAFLYEKFVRHLAARLSESGDRRQFVVAPDDRCGEFSAIQGNQWLATGQGEGDLGHRMQRYFADQLQEGGKTIVIGGDCLDVTSELIDQAFHELDDRSLVLGPSGDGGYYLIGFRGPWHPKFGVLFSEMPWGSAAVLPTTLGRLKRLDVEACLLEQHDDIDTLSDLQQLQQRSDLLSSELVDAIDKVLA